MSIEPILKHQFSTKKGSVKFTIKVNCKIELDDDNLNEITQAGSRRPNDKAIYSLETGGLDIRDSLKPFQKQKVLGFIKEITQNDPDYCIENDIINFTSHITDYCEKSPQVLEGRGWPTEEDELAEEIIHMICNLSDVQKAKITFFENGLSREKLTYTVVGSHNGYEGRFSIKFSSEISGKGTETIVTVTVLERRKESHV